MTTLAHVTLDTGHTRASPRSEVQNDIIALLKPIVAAGGRIIKDLHISIESHSGPLTVFSLGWEAGNPAVRCWVVCRAIAGRLAGNWTTRA